MAENKERLLQVWIDGCPDSANWRKSGMRNHLLTARCCGISLFTAPAVAQERAGSFGPVTEVPGISYLFEDGKGNRVQGFGGELGGSTYVATFEYFFRKHPMDEAEWLLADAPKSPAP